MQDGYRTVFVLLHHVTFIQLFRYWCSFRMGAIMLLLLIYADEALPMDDIHYWCISGGTKPIWVRPDSAHNHRHHAQNRISSSPPADHLTVLRYWAVPETRGALTFVLFLGGRV